MVVSLPRLFAFFAFLANSGFAITIANESPAVNYRFSSGFRTGAPVANASPSFVAAGYDLSSIGWWSQPGDQQRVKHTTLVAPLFSVNASHYPFAVGDTVEFLGTNGTLQTNTVAFRSTAFGDASVTRYSSAFTETEQVSVIRILDISSLNYSSQPALMAGSQGMAVPNGAFVGTEFATARVSSVGVASSSVSFITNSQDSSLTFKGLQSGDSGSPTLIPYNGKITLIGTVTGGGGSGSTYAPTAQTASVNNLLSAYGYALRFTIYDVPSDAANTANVWTGGAGTGAFSNGGNWSKGSAPGSLPVVFDAGSAGGQSVVALSGNQLLRGMLFRANAGSTGFTFNGSGTLTIGTTGLRNEDAKTQTFNVALALSGAQNWEAAGGDLVFNGNVGNGGNLLVVQGAKNTVINGIVSGTGGLAKDESGTLTLGGGSTYSGKTFLHNGVLKAGTDNVFSTASTVAFDTSNSGAVLDLNGKSAGVGNLQSELDGKGRVALNGGTLSTGYLNTAATYAGTFEGQGSVVKQGTATWTLTGDNSSFQGSLISANGILQIGASHALGGGQNIVQSGGRVQTNSSLDVYGNLTFTATQSGALAVTGGFGGNALAALGDNTFVTYRETITLDRQGSGTGDVKYNFRTAGSGTQRLVIAGDVTTTGSVNGAIGLESWTPGATQNVIDFQGRLGEGMGGPQLKFNVTGSGTTLLSRAAGNDYTGTTIVFTAATLLVNNSSGSGTGSGAIDVRSTATLGGGGIIAPGGTNGLAVASGGRLTPGNGGLGVFTVNLASTTGKAVFQPGAKFIFDLDSPGLADTLAFTGGSAGDVAFNGNVVDFANLGGLAPGDYSLFTFDAANAYAGNLVVGSGLGNYEASFIYNSHSIVLHVVPEPSASIILLGGLGFLAAFANRKRATRGSFSQGMSAKRNAPVL